MEQTQSTGSEPYVQPAPQPMAAAPPPARRTDVSKPGLVIAVIALALALIGMVAFPGPVGEEGLQGEAGAQGPTGDDGDDGSDGAQGPTGPQGPSGADGVDGANGMDGVDGVNGIACWDLNGNGTGDIPAEDINGDLVVDVLDCTGPQGLQGDPGPQGPPGVSAYQIVFVTEAHDSWFDFYAFCPAGKKVLGGGHNWDTGATDVWFWQSSPAPGGNGWHVRGTVDRGGSFSDITAFAICAIVT